MVPLTEQQQTLISQIAKDYDLSLIVLYGSQARGTAVKESDTDIAVRGRKALTLEQRLELGGRFDKVFKEAEVADIKSASPLFLAAIAKDAKLLYQSEPSTFDEFKLYAYNSYFDFKPALDRMRRETSAKIKELFNDEPNKP